MFLCWTSYWPLIKDCALQTKKIPCSPPGVPHLWSWCSPWPGWWTSRGWCWWCRGRGGREKGWHSCRPGPSGSSLSSPPNLAKFIFWNWEWNYRFMCLLNLGHFSHFQVKPFSLSLKGRILSSGVHIFFVQPGLGNMTSFVIERIFLNHWEEAKENPWTPTICVLWGLRDVLSYSQLSVDKLRQPSQKLKQDDKGWKGVGKGHTKFSP